MEVSCAWSPNTGCRAVSTYTLDCKQMHQHCLDQMTDYQYTSVKCRQHRP